MVVGLGAEQERVEAVQDPHAEHRPVALVAVEQHRQRVAWPSAWVARACRSSSGPAGSRRARGAPLRTSSGDPPEAGCGRARRVPRRSRGRGYAAARWTDSRPAARRCGSLGLALPPDRMPAWRGTRPLKRWRYVGVYTPELMLCVGDARIGRRAPALVGGGAARRDAARAHHDPARRCEHRGLARARAARGDVEIELELEERDRRRGGLAGGRAATSGPPSRRPSPCAGSVDARRRALRDRLPTPASSTTPPATTCATPPGGGRPAWAAPTTAAAWAGTS